MHTHANSAHYWPWVPDTRMRHVAFIYRPWVSSVQASLHSKIPNGQRHLDWFSRFHMANGSDQCMHNATARDICSNSPHLCTECMRCGLTSKRLSHSCCMRVLLGGGFLKLMKKAVFSPWSNRLNGMGTSLPTTFKTLDELRQELDDNLFHSSRYNPHHVLHRLLPQPKDTGYKLRQRAHNLTLPSDVNSTTKQNFIFRMLFDDMYWTVLFRILNVYLFRIFLLHLYS